MGVERKYILIALCVASASACKRGGDEGGKLSPRVVADAVHAVIEADRTVYAQRVVNRLQDQEGVIKASEHWDQDKALPLPAQMLRMGAELARERNARVTYSLLSLWAINKKNLPTTDVEREGLRRVAEDKGKTFYGQEDLASRRYLTAVYPDVAVAEACVNCHNGHKDSPRNDFKVGDVMGAIVVRVAFEP